MDSVIFGSIACLILISLVKYLQHTSEYALVQRWELVKFIKPMLQDDNYSNEFKSMLLGFYHMSLDRNIIVKMIFRMCKELIFNKNLKNDISVFKKEFNKMDKDFINMYQDLNAIFIKITFYNAPHWYLIFGIFGVLIFIINFIFSKANNLLTKVSLDDLLFFNISKDNNTKFSS